jgi:type IV pilus assembly protein PilY1
VNAAAVRRAGAGLHGNAPGGRTSPLSAAGLATAAIALLVPSVAPCDATRAVSAPVPDVPHAWIVIADSSRAADVPRPARTPFRVDVAYAAPGCVPGRIYWQRGGGSPPRCASTQWVEAAAATAHEGLRCASAATELAARGWSAAGALRQWDPATSQWTPLAAGTRGAVECRDDRGMHGPAAGRWYAADGGPDPWSASAAAELAWDEHRDTYTLYTSSYLAWWHGQQPRANVAWREPQASGLSLAAARSTGSATLLRHSWNLDAVSDAAAEGGMTLFGAAAAREAAPLFASALQSSPYGGGAPVAETLLEAFAVLRGEPVGYGLESHATPTRAQPSAAETTIGGGGTHYRSPVPSACSRAHVLLLGAGAPASDAGATARLWPDGAAPECRAAVPGDCASRLLTRVTGRDSSPLPGLQPILWDWLVSADEGAWTRLLDAPPRTVSPDALAVRLAALARSRYDAPAASTPAATGAQVAAVTSGGGRSYAGWFEPSAADRWRGGLRELRFENDGDALAAPTAEDEATPAPPDRRRLYTDVAGSNLTSPANRIDTANVGIGAVMLGLEEPDSAERDRTIAWALGVDTEDSDRDGDRTEARGDLGAVLGTPGVVRYADGRTVVYAGTGDGFLHAFAGGRHELWSYVPGAFVGRLATLRSGTRTGQRHAGLDGDVRVLVVDTNADRKVDPARGERALLVFGLRRGGRAYYAVDVSDPDAPKLAWRLSARDLPGLGQTWAAPVPLRLTIGGVRQNSGRYVVLLAGGHDPAQDRPRPRARDRVGAALYLVDALSGARLWHASSGFTPSTPDLSVPTLDFGIAAAPRALDLDGDGELDRAYVADTGGQLFRFEFTRGAPPSELARATRLARLGGAAAADRRFYAEPDVSIVRRGAERPYLAVTLGSGFAPDPRRRDVEDRLYSIRDPLPDVHRPAPVLAAVTDDELPDVTAGGVPPSARGWKRRLQLAGEQVLVVARTIEHRVVVPAWIPPTVALDEGCVQPAGNNRLHVVDVRTGRPRAFRVIEAEDPPDPEPRVLPTSAVAPALSLVSRPADGRCRRNCRQRVSGLIGTDAVQVDWPGGVVRAGWAERNVE